jgi:hypothetical protein
MSLGTTSRARLSTCHPEIQRLIVEVARGVDEGDLAYAGIADVTVLCGWRGKFDQDKAHYVDKTSKTPWPRSAHNVTDELGRPRSRAADVAPYPIPLKADGSWDERKFEVLHAYVAGVAHALGIDLFDISWDRPHIQLGAGVP